MAHIYTMEYYSAIKKNENAICSNMDGPKWSKSDKDKYMISLTGEILKSDTN